MKIVSVLTAGVEGGAEFASVALLDALCGQGHTAVMLSDLTGITRGTRVKERALSLGPKLSARSFVGLSARFPVLRRRLIAALEAERDYDLLLLHFKKEQLLAATLPRRLRPAVAWAEWGPVPFPLRRGMPGALYRWAGRGVDAVLCVSEGTKASVVASGVPAERAHVVPNVVAAATIAPRPDLRAAARAALGVPDDAFVVGCMSRFHPKKTNDVLIDALVVLDDPRVHLVLAGSGPTEQELRDRAAPLGDRAHFVPAPGNAAPELLAGWDLAAFCPSPTEGAPLAVIVSMLCELPVVATGAEGATGLVVPGTGVIAEPEHDPEAVASAVAAYRDDSDRRRAEGERGRRRIADLHDAEAVAARAEAVLVP